MNIDQIRRDTPGCEDKLFFNSAGSSLSPEIVFRKIKEYLSEEEKIEGYKLADLRAAEIDEFYAEAARLINCKPENIAFAHNATDAYVKALSSIDFKSGDTIITTDDDYVSNQINFISLQNRMGIKIIRIKNTQNGALDINDFENLITKHNPKLIAVTHIPTNSGLIQNVEEVGAICEKHNVIYLLDACQSVGQLRVDVKKIKCDFLSVTGRKFLRGPRGTGFLYVSDAVLEKNYAPLFVELRGATWTGPNEYKINPGARRFENWEIPYALLLGLKEAIRYANTMGMEYIYTYNQKILTQLKSKLSSIQNVTLLDKGNITSNILTFTKEGKSLDEMKSKLDQNKVYYSISLKSNAFIDFSKKQVEWAIRLSPHYFNTLEEMDRLAEIIQEI